MNFGIYLQRAARQWPDHPAVLFRDRSLSYRDLESRSNRLAHALRALGLRRVTGANPHARNAIRNAFACGNPADAHDGRGPTIALGLAALFACVAAGFSLRRLCHGVPGKSE